MLCECSRMADLFASRFSCPKLLRGVIFTQRELHVVFCFKVVCLHALLPTMPS